MSEPARYLLYIDTLQIPVHNSDLLILCSSRKYSICLIIPLPSTLVGLLICFLFMRKNTIVCTIWGMIDTIVYVIANITGNFDVILVGVLIYFHFYLLV